ncbi:type I restriction enzyme S subunit [Bradyrhizobium ottawaense]|uniref:restriction endonuclease subunit S n=1 Tax=Bradyrhizobium ottawaense TaxID=931866 RepID=UPI003837F816
MSFPRYPSYRESSVEWLGNVPAHWAVIPFKQVIQRIESGTSVNAVDTPAATGERGVLKTSCVYSGEFNAAENKAIIPEEYDRASCPLRAGTLIVSRMNTPDLVGAAGLVRAEAEELYLPDRLWQLHFKNCEPAFVHFWTATAAYRSQVQVCCSGTSSSMQNLAQDQLRAFWFPNPPRREQAQIVRFLDRETKKIDDLVEEQQQLIDLLKEKRQAVISHTVTKGLHSGVEMKASGKEWLGPVPKHWEITNLGAISAKIGSGKTPLGGAEVYSSSGILFLRSQNVYDEGLQLDDVVYIENLIDEEMAGTRVFPGDILLNITGASLGRTELVPDQFPAANVNQHVCIIRLRDLACRRFVSLFLKSCVAKVQFELGQSGAAREGLNFQAVSKLILPLPPKEEQTLIVGHVQRSLSQINKLIQEASKAVELLQERRAALVSAAVTGKIDVRGLVDCGVADVVAA